jgi:hypothetical protein
MEQVAIVPLPEMGKWLVKASTHPLLSDEGFPWKGNKQRTEGLSTWNAKTCLVCTSA